jgi:hypothetical protein
MLFLAFDIDFYDILIKNPAASTGFFVREEKVLGAFLILPWGSAAPP